MRTRSLLQATFNIRGTPASQLPPTFLLPCRARLHQAAASTSTQFQYTHTEIPPQPASSPLDEVADVNVEGATGKPGSRFLLPTGSKRPLVSLDSLDDATTTTPTFTKPRTRVMNPNPPRQATPPPPTRAAPPLAAAAKPLILSKSLQTLLPLFEAQKPHYISAHIHRFPYLLTPGDTLRLPFHMHGVSPGDILRLNRASLLGSRDYTLKAGADSSLADNYDGQRTPGGPKYLDERLFECRVRVLGVDSGPMVVKEKTKRRQRRVKTVRSKHLFTVLKVMEVRVKGLEELGREAGQLVLE